MFERDALFIGGRWSQPIDSQWLEVHSPSSELMVGRVPAATTGDVDRAVDAARAAFDEGPWPRLSVAERGRFLFRVLDGLQERLSAAIEVQIDEMGGTRGFLTATMNGLMRFLQRAVEDSNSIHEQEVRLGTTGKVVVLREPLGVVAGVIPWNSPNYGRHFEAGPFPPHGVPDNS